MRAARRIIRGLHRRHASGGGGASGGERAARGTLAASSGDAFSIRTRRSYQAAWPVIGIGIGVAQPPSLAAAAPRSDG